MLVWVVCYQESGSQMHNPAETAPKRAGVHLYNERTVWDRERHDLGVTPEDDAPSMICVKQRHIEAGALQGVRANRTDTRRTRKYP